MAQESSLVIKIDSRNAETIVKRLNEEFAKMEAAGNRAGGSTERLGDTTNKLGRITQITNNVTQNFNTTVNNSTRNLEQNQRQTDRNSRSTQDMSRNNQAATASANQMSNAYRSLAGYMAGMVTVGAAISKMDAYTEIYNKLKLVTNSQQELNTAMADTFAIAQRSAATWESVNDVYSKYMSNAKTLNLTQADAARLTEITSKAVAMSGSTTQAAAGALFQYGQSLDGNILRAQEFNSLVDGAGGLLNAMAKGLNVTRGGLRQMMIDGKLTGEVITKALLEAGDSVEKLYGKTDTSISGSMTQLNGAIIKFVGEASKGSGAASTMSSSIKSLADNLEGVANVAVLGGVALLTKAIVSQTIATYDAIGASITRRAAATAELQSQAQLTAIELQRARSVSALALTEVNLARAEFNSATTREARAAATMRLTQAEIAHRASLVQTTAATAANTAAQNALNASQTFGARALGLLGGWTGVLTIGVTALVAGYMLFKDSVEKTTPVLDKQNKSVQDLTEEFIKLDEAKQRQAVRDQVKDIEELTSAHRKQELAMLGLGRVVMNNTELSLQDREAAKKLYEQYTQGKINAEQFSTSLNKLGSASKELKERIDKQSGATSDSNRALEAAIRIRDAFLGQSKNVVDANNNEAKSIDAKREAQQKLNAEQQKVYDDLDRNLQKEAYVKNNMKVHGWSREYAEFVAENREKAKMSFVGSEKISPELMKKVDANFKLKQDAEARSKSEKETTKEIEKQNKALEKQAAATKRLVGISGDTGVGKAHVHLQYGGAKKGQRPSTEHMNRIQAGGRSLQSYGITSDVGRRDTGIKGASKDHKGVDFGVPAGKPITTTAAVKDVKTWFDKKGGGYVSTITFEDGVILEVLHQSSSVMSKVKGGATTGAAGSSAKDELKAQKDAEREAEQQAKNQIQLTLAVADEKTRINTKLQEDLKEINKAGFSPEETARLTAQYKERAANEIAIAEHALKTKLDDYRDFQKTESELLEKSFNQKKFAASRDLELSKTERDEAVVLLGRQLKQEQAMLAIAKEQRMFQIRIQLMSETQALEGRYNIEEQKLANIDNLQQRNYERQMLRLEKEMEVRRLLGDAASQWGQMDAEMRGTTGRLQVDQTRINRSDASEGLYNANVANINVNEQSSLSGAQDQLSSGQISPQDFEAQKTAIIQAALEARQAMYEDYAGRQVSIETAYQQDSINLQLTQAQQLTGSFAGMFRGILGESSGAYKMMYAMQQGFAITQAGMNMWTSASSAYNEEKGTVWQKMAAAGKAVLDQGTFLAMIQSITPQGFATGGQIRGAGTGTSDSIPIFASDKEFMIKASSAQSIGLDNLNHMNQTGQLPQIQRERQTARTLQSQGDVINAPISVQVTIQADGKSEVDSQGQSKELGLMIGNAVRAVIRQEQRQGGLLSR